MLSLKSIKFKSLFGYKHFIELLSILTILQHQNLQYEQRQIRINIRCEKADEYWQIIKIFIVI